MKKLVLAFVASLLVNALLAGWLIAQYNSDVYFRAFVDQSFGSYSTYIILTIGVGGGSSLGYLFLRRKGHGDHSPPFGFQKTKPLKADGGLHSPQLTASQNKMLPTGAPPTPPSKHTAYAVPPISKGPSSTSTGFQKSSANPTWTGAGKQAMAKAPSSPSTSIPSPKPSTSSQVSMDRARPPSTPPTFEPRPPSSAASSQTSPPPAPSSFTPPFTRPLPPTSTSVQSTDQFQSARQQPEVKPSQDLGFSKWTSEPGSLPVKGESIFSPGRSTNEGLGGTEGGLKRVPIQGAGPNPAPPISQPQVQPQIPASKWQAADSITRPNLPPPTGQWVSPVPKQPYNPAGRPGPPGVNIPGQRPQSSQGAPTRPGQAPPPRPLYAPGQGPPRPLSYPGAPRSMQPGGSTPGGFRPGLVVTGPQGAVPRGPPPGQAPGQRSQQPPNFPQGSSVKSPLPPSTGRPGLGEVPNTPRPSGLTTAGQETQSGQSSSSSEERPSTEASSSSEMDWDTALDTILKTLRKDKVEEK